MAGCTFVVVAGVDGTSSLQPTVMHVRTIIAPNWNRIIRVAAVRATTRAKSLTAKDENVSVGVAYLKFQITVGLFFQRHLDERFAFHGLVQCFDACHPEVGVPQSGGTSPRQIRFLIIRQVQQHQLGTVAHQTRVSIRCLCGKVTGEREAKLALIPVRCRRNVGYQKSRDGRANLDLASCEYRSHGCVSLKYGARLCAIRSNSSSVKGTRRNAAHHSRGLPDMIASDPYSTRPAPT